MGKKLNVSAVNSAAKKINHRKMFHLTDNQGEIWDVEIDVNMSPENVIKMVQNVVMMSVKITEEKIDYFELFNPHPYPSSSFNPRYFTQFFLSSSVVIVSNQPLNVLLS